MTDWLTDWWLTDGLMDWLMDLLIAWRTNWLNDGLTEWRTDWLNYMGTLSSMYLTFVFRERLANAFNNTSVCLDFGHFLRGKAYSSRSHARVSCHNSQFLISSSLNLIVHKNQDKLFLEINALENILVTISVFGSVFGPS